VADLAPISGIYADESSQNNHHYLVLGALAIAIFDAFVEFLTAARDLQEARRQEISEV
jgi:hypothetical protein